MALNLDGRTVVITGASRGIGVRIARDLAGTGARLVLTARDEARLEAVAAELRALGADVLTIGCDVTREADRKRLVEAAGDVDVLVNNAGVEVTVSVVDHTSDDIEREIATNLAAPIHLTRAVVPGMVTRGRGAVVMISSMSGKSPTPYNAIYTATKFGLNGFAASLRIELEGTGVHVGTVCPSFVADVGMFSDTGLAAPRMVKEVSPERVVAGVRRVIAGAPEVLVTTPLARPMLALVALWPSLDGLILRRLGVLEALKERARAVLARRNLESAER